MSRYPTLGRSLAVSLAEALLRGDKPTVDDKAEWRGRGDDVNLTHLDRAIQLPRQDLTTAKRKPDVEVFEGRLTAAIHPVLATMPAEALEDEGFWRYLALSRFWWFIEWREAAPLERGNVATYVDGRQPAESIPLRLFIRGQAVDDDGEYGRGFALSKSADFWRSHVLRVRTGTCPVLTRALVDFQRSRRLPAGEMRELAKLINRAWSNLVLHTYSYEEIASLLDELHEELIGPGGRNA